MGTISNLATTGVYTYEEGALKVVFNFNINNETKFVRVNDGRIYEGETLLCTFNADSTNKMNVWGIPNGRGVECANAWESAISQFESKIKE